MGEIEFAANATDGRYFAKGNRVFKAPHQVEDRGPNGEKVLLTSMGFWVCDCNTGIAGCAEIVAHVMQHEDKLREALAEAIQAIKELAPCRSLTAERLQEVLDAATPPAQSAG